MFDIPGFDPKIFSDTELFDKQLELTRRSFLASRFGKVEMVNQLQYMIQAIEIERRERMFNESIGKWMRSSSPVAVETDPDLHKQQLETEEVEQIINKPKPEQRKVREPIRTSKPVNPSST